MDRRFQQVDVFTDVPTRGNPVAVVIDGGGLDEDAMRAFAAWTNLSETTFLLPPRDPAADYRVRILTPDGEPPFAGHPTLGSAHAWLAAGGRPQGERVVQECEVGLVTTSILFAFLHSQYGISFVLAGIFVVGVILGLERKYLGTTAALITHAIFNAIAVLASRG